MIKIILFYQTRGGLGVKIGPGETENSAQFWAHNKIL